jgi:hypothetical protein
MSPQGKWVEVQIRSTRMDEIAEKGLAAHYKYKEDKSEDSKFDRWIAEIRDLMENPELSAMDFVNEFKMNLFSEEIYVFTPKGELRVLPTGATKALLGAAGAGAKLLTGSGIMPKVPEPSAPDGLAVGAAIGMAPAGAAIGAAPAAAGAAPNNSGYSLRPVSSNLSCSRSFCSISTPFS